MVIKTGLSEFHKMVVTILKTYFTKQRPNTSSYGLIKKGDHEEIKTQKRVVIKKILLFTNRAYKKTT